MAEKPKEKLYEIIVRDDVSNIILRQIVISNNYNAVDLQAQKYKMFYGFGTTYEIEE